jgi:lysophospholipase L1-like esterase
MSSRSRSRQSRSRRTRGNRKFTGFAIAGLVVAAALAGGAVYGLVSLQADRAAKIEAENSEYVPYVAETAAPDEVASTVAFLGDSYTHGTGATDAAHRWSSLVSVGMGWTENNFGLGGTGFVTSSAMNGCGREYCPTYEEQAAEGIAAETVVVAGGQNDLDEWAADSAAVTNAISRTYTHLRSTNPDSVIIAVGPSAIGSVSPAVAGMDAAVQTAAAAVGAQYISLINPDVLNVDMATADGGHVDDVGHQAIATAVLAALQ